LVALDHVTKQKHINVALQKLPPLGRGQIRGFREPVYLQIAGEVVVERRCLAVGEGGWIGRNLLLMMAEKLPEAKGMDADLPSPAAHGGGDLSAEELGG